MKKHQRQIIREKIRELLLQKTWAEKRVFSNRSASLFESELPAILLYTRDESARQFTEAPRQLRRQLNLSIQAICRLQDQVDDYLDQLALQIESVFNANPFLDGTVADTLLTATEVEISSEGNMPIGSITLNYQVEYYQYTPEEPADSDEFAVAEIQHQARQKDHIVNGDDQIHLS